MFCGRPRKFFTRSLLTSTRPAPALPPAAHGRVASEQVVLVKLLEEVLGNHLGPHKLGIVGSVQRITKLGEGCINVRVGGLRHEQLVLPLPAVHGPENPACTNRLMEEVCERETRASMRQIQFALKYNF